MYRKFCFQILALILVALPAFGFVVEGPKQPAPTAQAHLNSAARWAPSSGSFLTGGARGLGGGLEYAVDRSICQMDFIDGSDCADRIGAIRAALDHWSSGHPDIIFSDVTGLVAPAFPRRASDDRLAGAEIDFFATNRRQFQAFATPSVNGFTVFYDEDVASLPLTNGTVLQAPVSRIDGADVHFNRQACYYIDVDKKQDACVHFPSLILHEISHALGIGHPEANVRYNLDNDDIPGNEITIDCMAPEKGLKAMPDYDGAAVAHGQDVQGPGRWRRGLTWDDVAARDALYPNCAIERIDRAPPSWGAFALSADGATGVSRFATSKTAAGKDAIAKCEVAGGPCRVVSRFNGCFAFATNQDGAFGHAQASRSDHARVDAVLSCLEAGKDCRVRVSFCAYE